MLSRPVSYRITSAMECADVAGFTSATYTGQINIVFSLQVYIGRSDGH